MQQPLDEQAIRQIVREELAKENTLKIKIVPCFANGTLDLPDDKDANGNPLWEPIIIHA